MDYKLFKETLPMVTVYNKTITLLLDLIIICLCNLKVIWDFFDMSLHKQHSLSSMHSASRALTVSNYSLRSSASKAVYSRDCLRFLFSSTITSMTCCSIVGSFCSFDVPSKSPKISKLVFVSPLGFSYSSVGLVATLSFMCFISRPIIFL